MVGLRPLIDASSWMRSQRLNAALAEIYRIFDAPTPAAIDGCPCCISTRSVDVLLTAPLREITGQQLWRYVSGAFWTVGGVTDFRYLLPRILDVSVNDPDNANDPEIVLNKLSLADWRSWVLPEQQAIEEFVDAWFEDAITRDLATAAEGWIGAETESVLCGAARAEMPLERWLMRLQEPDAAALLADFRERFPLHLSAFWEYAPTGYEQFSEILSRGNA